MIAFIAENLATIIVLAVVVLLAGFAVHILHRDRKNGKACGCGGSCAGCSACAKKDESRQR